MKFLSFQSWTSPACHSVCRDCMKSMFLWKQSENLFLWPKNKQLPFSKGPGYPFYECNLAKTHLRGEKEAYTSLWVESSKSPGNNAPLPKLLFLSQCVENILEAGNQRTAKHLVRLLVQIPALQQDHTKPYGARQRKTSFVFNLLWTSHIFKMSCQKIPFLKIQPKKSFVISSIAFFLQIENNPVPFAENQQFNEQ